jgi:tripartite-type tricarboxylate transporter receptor subunit TctC
LDGDVEGYTLAYINVPNIITGYLNPAAQIDKTLDDFELIANHVLDYGCIAVRSDDSRFIDFNELMRYAQEQEVTATTTGYTGDDNIAQLKINQKYNTKFVGTHFRGTAQGIDSVIKGYVDVVFANVGELAPFHKRRQLKVVAVMSKSRVEVLPDVPTMEEYGYGGVYSYSARGIAIKKGVDPGKVKRLVDAFEAAINNPDHIQKMREAGLLVKYMKGVEYRNFLLAEEDSIQKEVVELLGWNH